MEIGEVIVDKATGVLDDLTDELTAEPEVLAGTDTGAALCSAVACASVETAKTVPVIRIAENQRPFIFSPSGLGTNELLPAHLSVLGLNLC